MALINEIKVTDLVTKAIIAKTQTPWIASPDALFSGKSVTRPKNAVFEEKNLSVPRLMLRFLYGNFKLRT
jgi:hypothetical protein